jgi:hypothetical protein
VAQDPHDDEHNQDPEDERQHDPVSDDNNEPDGYTYHEDRQQSVASSPYNGGARSVRRLETAYWTRLPQIGHDGSEVCVGGGSVEVIQAFGELLIGQTPVGMRVAEPGGHGFAVGLGKPHVRLVTVVGVHTTPVTGGLGTHQQEFP